MSEWHLTMLRQFSHAKPWTIIIKSFILSLHQDRWAKMHNILVIVLSRLKVVLKLAGKHQEPNPLFPLKYK